MASSHQLPHFGAIDVTPPSFCDLLFHISVTSTKRFRNSPSVRPSGISVAPPGDVAPRLKSAMGVAAMTDNPLTLASWQGSPQKSVADRLGSEQVEDLLSSASSSAQCALHITVEGRGVLSPREKHPAQRLGKDRPRSRPQTGSEVGSVASVSYTHLTLPTKA